MSEPKSRSNFAERLAFSTREAARVLGVSEGLMDRWVNTGRIGSVKVGHRRLISRQTLDALLAGGVPEPKKPKPPTSPPSDDAAA
jgi:excisionase family DNA binding protein